MNDTWVPGLCMKWRVTGLFSNIYRELLWRSRVPKEFTGYYISKRGLTMLLRGMGNKREWSVWAPGKVDFNREWCAFKNKYFIVRESHIVTNESMTLTVSHSQITIMWRMQSKAISLLILHTHFLRNLIKNAHLSVLNYIDSLCLTFRK